jgi:cupin fold WbuC family metalloprotein
MKVIDIELLNNLSEQAKQSDRLRKNFNFHESEDDLLQRMLNAFEPGTYVQPHRHLNPNKREVFMVLTGSLLIVIFNDDGSIKGYQILNQAIGKYAVEIAIGEWHTVTSLQSGTVAYEFKDGPYSVHNDKDFATWAPHEDDHRSKAYLNNLFDQLQIANPLI